jgi:hypothetical protein
MGAQLCVARVVIPCQHQDAAVLAGQLQRFSRNLMRLRRRVGAKVPLILWSYQTAPATEEPSRDDPELQAQRAAHSANNKLRLDDERGKEHIKLSTEYGGKSQLNLGHLVDAGKQQRGEGFELRTDMWGVIRAKKGIFISADGQDRAQTPGAGDGGGHGNTERCAVADGVAVGGCGNGEC